jgi:hypothetical protein
VTEPGTAPPDPAKESAEEPEGAPTSGSRPSRADPEDWAATRNDDDERYTRERPPHWE